MTLTIYKGFNNDFLEKLEAAPLVPFIAAEKKNVFLFDKSYRKRLEVALLTLEETSNAWITYEEYSLIKNRVSDAIKEDGLEVILYRNNLFPDYYPIEFDIEETTARKIIEVLNANNIAASNDSFLPFTSIYNTLIDADGIFFGSFYNYEYESESGIRVIDYYPQNLTIEDTSISTEYTVSLNEDIDTYLRDLVSIRAINPKTISVSSTNGYISQRVQKSLQAYCLYNGIRLCRFNEQITDNVSLEDQLIDIAKNTIKIDGFTSFRMLKFYKNPDIDKEVVEISQSRIIHEIIHQAESAYNYARGDSFRDIFITASTGAGKSVMFQIPAVYLAKKHKKLTIIIEPVKALMQDQKDKLFDAGYTRVETFNSDLITQVEKEKALQRIKGGEVDLLYLSPETLLSYSIETLIGDREIGLVIVDEAHIVTTWGIGFRPDYWYLGGYLNKLRNQIQTKHNIHQKLHHFPICAFTATAVNGGLDDSVGDLVSSLYMENPIKYLGFVRRDDIHFDISHSGTVEKLPKAEYDELKCKALDNRIKCWLSKKEKTIVYFPYATFAHSAAFGQKEFSGITTDRRIGEYTGRNLEGSSRDVFSEKKRQTFDAFKSGQKLVMFSTKAFGMGIDVNDVKNVYHYAVSGNLSDYVQEIGRAARKTSMEGTAITDFFYNDMTFMKVLFGMSQIKQYQVKRVLEGVYSVFKSKGEARSFLISPESFTYIFNDKDEDSSVNKLKTCLLMLEKDFYDKYNFKVLIARPQSVFTKAFICVVKGHEREVLSSEYGKYMRYVSKGRYSERQPDGVVVSDLGDIYSLDLKGVWEEFYPNISFPQFKYYYFNPASNSADRIEVLLSIRENIAPRQKVTIKARGSLLLSELREKILQDFEYVADTLYSEFRKQYFTSDEVTRVLREKYGITRARLIANSLFELVDPNGRCVKHRSNETVGKMYYNLSNGNLKEYMRRVFIRVSL